MGNWRTVNIEGTCGVEDVPALREYLRAEFEDEQRWGCLHDGGMCGLGNWARMRIGAIGNLAERDYSPKDVADELRKIRELIAPSLRCKVHCGGDYEDLACVATVLCGDDGVTVAKPEVESVMRIPEDQIAARFRAAINVW